VSDAKRVWVVVVIWELCALPMFVVRFKYVKEETAAPNGLCDLKKTDSYYIPRYKCPSKRLFSIQQPQPCTAEGTWEIKYIIIIIIYRRCDFLKTYRVKSILPYYRSIIFFK